ncbi:alpha/beta fold hydrolase [Rhodophyticola sp. CCM32]|uniref:alpha/beta fold hydrolase n=1 Tax=Rhodophyticola sp. CCM32 TaxID=2916397 RepID=UPI00107FBC80|nr:alpha/beta fold hydrolase [Rhodophyticola sp. CCM32]QBY02590.1 alpha/beta fold hydrolase [Rhodophyticola sp. CCM32]
MAEPLVLLPGMMCDARVWWPQMTALSGAYVMHMAPITGAAHVETLAAQVLEGAPERFALAGLGLGGVVAMEMYRRAPDRISRIALMDTTPLAETPVVAATREPQIVAAKAGRLDQVICDEIQASGLTSGTAQGAVMELALDMAEGLGPDIFVAQSRAMQRRQDQQAVLRRISVPALVLCGEYDALCPVRRHEFMADLIPGATLEVIGGSGHLPTLEQPGASTRALQTWLEAGA